MLSGAVSSVEENDAALLQGVSSLKTKLLPQLFAGAMAGVCVLDKVLQIIDANREKGCLWRCCPAQHCVCSKSGCSSIALCICFGTCSHANCDGHLEVMQHESVIDEVLHSEDDKRKRFPPHTRGFVHFSHVSRGKIAGLRENCSQWPLRVACRQVSSSQKHPFARAN